MQHITMGGALLCLLLALQAYGQRLQVGDRLPNATLPGVVHYKSDQIELKDFAGKYLILELWTKNCVVCIKGFPKLLKLQERYKDNLQIITVNGETKEETRKILERIKLPPGNVPFVTADKMVSNWFPRNYNPWMVWIDKEGIVRYITDGEWVTEENIALFTRGRRPKMRQNEYLRPSDGLPLIAQENGRWLPKIDYYSYLSHCIKARSIRNYDLKDSLGVYRLTRNCSSPVELLIDAFGEGNRERFAHANKVILQIKDTYRLQRPFVRDTSWENLYSYSYEIAVPKGFKGSVFKMMQEDLQRFFDIKVEVRKEKIPSLVLVRTDSIDRIRTKGGTPESNFSKGGECTKRFLRNQPFHMLVDHYHRIYSRYHSKAPLVDGTGYQGNIDIILDHDLVNLPNLPLLKKALRAYGLDIVLKEWENEVLVITEKERRN